MSIFAQCRKQMSGDCSNVKMKKKLVDQMVFHHLS
ncbi:hypothetical protein ACOMHN_054755 [Nucella lapillus]